MKINTSMSILILTDESGSEAETWKSESYTSTASDGLKVYWPWFRKKGLVFLLTAMVTVAVAV